MKFIHIFLLFLLFCPSLALGYPYPCSFSVELEWLYLKRNDYSGNVDIMSNGISGPIVLGLRDLDDFDYESAYRILGRYTLTNCDSIELSYLKTGEWNSSASVLSSTNNLFSVFSDFGINPFNGFDQTDRASFTGIKYTTDLYSIEANYRKELCLPLKCLRASLLGGFRYFNLDEKFRLNINGVAGSTDYRVRTHNDLYGGQIGGKLSYCFFSSLELSGEVKQGVYNNRSQQKTRVFPSQLAVFEENKKGHRATWSTEIVARLTDYILDRLKVYVGYDFLYFQNMALAPDNFNTSAAFVNPAAPSNVFLANRSYILYHGAIVGVERIF